MSWFYYHCFPFIIARHRKGRLRAREIGLIICAYDRQDDPSGRPSTSLGEIYYSHSTPLVFVSSSPFIVTFLLCIINKSRPILVRSRPIAFHPSLQCPRTHFNFLPDLLIWQRSFSSSFCHPRAIPSRKRLKILVCLQALRGERNIITLPYWRK